MKDYAKVTHDTAELEIVSYKSGWDIPSGAEPMAFHKPVEGLFVTFKGVTDPIFFAGYNEQEIMPNGMGDRILDLTRHEERAKYPALHR